MISRNLKLIVLLIIVGTIAAYFIIVVIPTQVAERTYEGARKLGKDFSEAFQFTPEVIVNNTIILNQQTPIMELATITQNFKHEYTYTNTWLNSTKEIKITGTFEAKAGYDLNERFSIRFIEDKAVVQLPNPKILSVESQGDIFYKDESGIWNWVNEDDRSKATNAFLKDARNYAEQAQFVNDAKLKMEEKIKAMLAPYTDQVEIQYSESIKREIEK